MSITWDPLSYSLGFCFVQSPSSRLANILSKHNLPPQPVYILEFSNTPIGTENKLSVKKPLIVLVGHTFVLTLKMVTCMLVVRVLRECICGFFFFLNLRILDSVIQKKRSHLYLLANGSRVVKNAVLRYGQKNFAFVVIETVANPEDKRSILSLEQKYIDSLKPSYNILKVAGSVLNLKWSSESKQRHSLGFLSDKTRMDNIRSLHLGKVVSPETKSLMRKAALNRKVTLETRDLMSKNNAKSVSITAYLNGVEFKKFPSTASAALYFF